MTEPVARRVEWLEEEEEASLLDVVDLALSKGVCIHGELELGVADVDLVAIRLSAVVGAANRILGPKGKADEEADAD